MTAVLVSGFVINLLMLAQPIYMLQVYDRVLASFSIETLTVLTILLMSMLALMGLIEWLRANLMARVGALFVEELAGAALAAAVKVRVRTETSARVTQDADAVRAFVSATTPLALLDLPWTFIFVACAFAIHPLIGTITLGAAFALFVLAVLSETASRNELRRAAAIHAGASTLAEATVRNAHAVAAMRMTSALQSRWASRTTEATAVQLQATDRMSAIQSVSRFTRIGVQSLVLGCGAYLVIKHEMTPGMMIAGSIIMGRGLSPVEQVVAGWRPFLSAREAYGRLARLAEASAQAAPSVDLPAPRGQLTLQGVAVSSPNGLILKGVSFRLEAGQALAVIGPTGAGKSTLARVIAGAANLTAGEVRLDGALPGDWSDEVLGRHIGYLPQEIELFDGTVAENICRFGKADSAKILKAAQLADVHEMILALPKGYDTPIGESGAFLSGGQRQRLGLARALFGEPALVVLDEPNSNLDSDGEEALARAIVGLKQAGVTTVTVTHRVPIVRHLDRALLLKDGVVLAFGPVDEVVGKLMARGPAAAPTSAAPPVQEKKAVS